MDIHVQLFTCKYGHNAKKWRSQSVNSSFYLLKRRACNFKVVLRKICEIAGQVERWSLPQLEGLKMVKTARMKITSVDRAR